MRLKLRIGLRAETNIAEALKSSKLLGELRFAYLAPLLPPRDEAAECTLTLLPAKTDTDGQARPLQRTATRLIARCCRVPSSALFPARAPKNPKPVKHESREAQRRSFWGWGS